MRIKCYCQSSVLALLCGSVVSLPNADSVAVAQQPTPLPQPTPSQPPLQPGIVVPPAGPGGTIPVGPRVKPFPIVDKFPPPGGIVVPGEVGYPGGTNTIKTVLPYQAPG